MTSAWTGCPLCQSQCALEYMLADQVADQQQQGLKHTKRLRPWLPARFGVFFFFPRGIRTSLADVLLRGSWGITSGKHPACCGRAQCQLAGLWITWLKWASVLYLWRKRQRRRRASRFALRARTMPFFGMGRGSSSIFCLGHGRSQG